MRCARLITHLGSMATMLLAATAGAHADLFAYLAKPEPKFDWKQINEQTVPEGRITEFAFTSQTWRGIDWSHQLRVYTPAQLKHPKLMLLFITGGSTDSQVKPQHHAEAFALAKACGGRVATLPQVPNQPLLGGKKEDDLIGETFVNFMNSQEPDWPLLLPMVKSAIKAMDTLQEWGRERREPVEGFVVTGASKRGWTTWLTAAADPRVKAIAPMVIPTLNMKAQTIHQKKSWGFFSEQIEDYTRRGLTEKFDDPVGKKLWLMVDPFTYLDRIKVPILQINGTNDRYWTLDSMNLYWDDIKAPKYVVYLPNAGHGLEKQREWAVNGIGALFRSVATGQALPSSTVSHSFSETDSLPRIVINHPDPKPKNATLWSAQSPTLDFREAQWNPAETRKWTGTELSFVAPKPLANPWMALFVEQTYEIEGLEYHLTTPIWLVDKAEIPKGESEKAP